MVSVRFLFCPLVLIVAAVMPAEAGARTRQAGLEAGEDRRAAASLHDVVSDPALALTAQDPTPFRRLAELYAEGRGVPRDPIAACALAQDAESAARMAPPKTPMITLQDAQAYEAGLKEAEAFAVRHCGLLPPGDLLSAARSRGSCYAFGMPEEVLTLGGHSVRIGRAGFGFSNTPEADLYTLPCPQLVAKVGGRSVEPPEHAAPGVKPRQFVELLSWHRGAGPTGSDGGYALWWRVFEVREQAVSMLVEERLATVSTWPGLGLPAGADARLTLEMIRSGHVRWRIDGTPPKRGWLMLPEDGSSR